MAELEPPGVLKGRVEVRRGGLLKKTGSASIFTGHLFTIS